MRKAIFIMIAFILGSIAIQAQTKEQVATAVSTIVAAEYPNSYVENEGDVLVITISTIDIANVGGLDVLEFEKLVYKMSIKSLDALFLDPFHNGLGPNGINSMVDLGFNHIQINLIFMNGDKYLLGVRELRKVLMPEDKWREIKL